jgi:PhnB protein
VAAQTPHVRNGFSAVRPYIFGPLSLIDWTKRVLGATELVRHEMSPTACHAEMQVGDSVLVLEAADPPHDAGTPGNVYVYVEDADRAHATALENGASEISPPEDKPYGERQGGVRDTYGNIWWIATYTEKI